MTVIIEHATPDDLETLVRVQIAAFHSDATYYPGVELGGPPGYDSRDANREMMQTSDYYKLIVDGQIAGGFNVYDKGEGVYHLGVLYVHPNYHNQGVGSAAMQYIAAAYPAKTWTLDTPGYATRNHRFYEKHGFVKEGERLDGGFLLIEYVRHT